MDRIEDIHAFTFQDGEAGTFLLADTFEHVADPIRAMGEIHRCLRDDGIVIFSSIMNFPIHGFPNDYWRFTPEAFRSLANKFPNSAIFYNGPEGFPHTVCGIAAKKPIDEALRVLIPLLAEIPVPAPLILEPRAASIIASLAAKLLPSGASAAPDASEFRGGLDQASQPGWLLVTGQWLDGWACMEGVSEVEVMAGGEVIHRARLRKPRPEAASRFGIDPSLPIAFHEQVNLSGRSDVTTTLKLVATDKAGSRRVLFESPAGILLGSFDPGAGFVLHSIDSPDSHSPLGKGRSLVDGIRTRGEAVKVDLGCGFRKNGNIGIDVTSQGTNADLICRLGFEPLPLDDESADEMYCRDFLEASSQSLLLGTGVKDGVSGD